MLALVNTNLIQPPIAPIGLDYVACAARQAGIPVEVLDLALEPDLDLALKTFFANHSPTLVGLSFRNNDDSFWPSAQWFAPCLARIVRSIRSLTRAPIVIGGVGFSVFASRILRYTGADFGIVGDGEQAVITLYRCLEGYGTLAEVPGLMYMVEGRLVANRPAWPQRYNVPVQRDMIDNRAYLRKGGQVGLETKRGCDRSCTFCADPLAKGRCVRLRPVSEVIEEARRLLDQGIDVLHICDGEFNIPYDHAAAVCKGLIEAGLSEHLRWYAYIAVTPFDRQLAGLMRRAGCVGVDITADAACSTMLRTYGHEYCPQDIHSTVKACRDGGIVVMTDLLLGGPGEDPETLAQTIDTIRQIGPDAVGAALGVRLYPGTALVRDLRSRGPLRSNPGIRRSYEGPIDLFRPTFYVSPELGSDPAGMVRHLAGDDPRFFLPAGSLGGSHSDHNYNANVELVKAIEAGHRGAYWHILLRLRGMG